MGDSLEKFANVLAENPPSTPIFGLVGSTEEAHSDKVVRDNNGSSNKSYGKGMGV